MKCRCLSDTYLLTIYHWVIINVNWKSRKVPKRPKAVENIKVCQKKIYDKRMKCDMYKHYKLYLTVFDVNELHSQDSKVDGANMGPSWVFSVPDGPHVGPMNFARRACLHRSHQLFPQTVTWRDVPSVTLTGFPVHDSTHLITFLFLIYIYILSANNNVDLRELTTKSNFPEHHVCQW